VCVRADAAIVQMIQFQMQPVDSTPTGAVIHFGKAATRYVVPWRTVPSAKRQQHIA